MGCGKRTHDRHLLFQRHICAPVETHIHGGKFHTCLLQIPPKRSRHFLMGVNKVRCANVRPALDAQIDITKPKLRNAPQGLIKRMLRETERGTSDVQHSELPSFLI